MANSTYKKIIGFSKKSERKNGGKYTHKTRNMIKKGKV